MSLLTSLQAQKADIEAQIAILTSVGEDVFSFGTIMLFSYQNGAKRYYVKVEEESWEKINDVMAARPLREWILLAKEGSGTYFEVHKLSVTDPDHPFYASA